MTLEKSKVDKVLSYRWAVFGILATAYFFVYFHRMSTAVVSTDLQITFGVGTAAIALLSSVYLYAYAVMQLPSGLLTDNDHEKVCYTLPADAIDDRYLRVPGTSGRC
jgi:sugar phosphate permease